MIPYVLHFRDIDKNALSVVGGKGANLGEMVKAGFPVPPGFCITTAAFQALLQGSKEMEAYFRQLAQIDPDELEPIRTIARSIQEHIEALPIPAELYQSIIAAWGQLGSKHAYAVRSSATAEDLPTASFAGQQETFLNVVGEQQLIRAILKCWASLFTERAIIYRMKNQFDHRAVQLSVVVQQMVFPKVSGIMFTADPLNGHRGKTFIEASFGLGEALVSGLVTPDRYTVFSGTIHEKRIAQKKVAIHPLGNGGTVMRDIPEFEQEIPSLTDEQVLELARLGAAIETHYGTEQDIEWSYADGSFFILQARPITSLFPIPQVPDEKFHVFLSFGHQQMMTEPMSPMAISFWQRLFTSMRQNLPTASGQRLFEAGGRLYMDSTEMLRSEIGRKLFPKMLGSMDELMSLAMMQVVQREEFKDLLPLASSTVQPDKLLPALSPPLTKVLKDLIATNPSNVYAGIQRFMDERLAACKAKLDATRGPERIDAIHEDLGTLFPELFEHDMHFFVTGMLANTLIRTFLQMWLPGQQAELPLLNRSLAHNATSEMGLQIGDLADAARPYPELLTFLQESDGDSFYEKLPQVEGGRQFKAALDSFLAKYGARCPGEIDIARPRWNEKPSMLIPAILGHVRTVEPQEHRARFAQGEQEAIEAGQRILDQLKQTEDGDFKQSLMGRFLNVYRGFGGLRENHKFVIVLHLDLYKKALLEEADSLVQKGILAARDDVFMLSLSELKDVLQKDAGADVRSLIQARQQAYQHYEKLTPPRVITSEGEVIVGKRSTAQLPEHALSGTPVSPGVVEGRARIVRKPDEASLEPGEILIAPFTDPGWTPLFHQAKGLVMEVGGIMTHGAVVAREYGIPAVVGIENATRLIKDGQYIRLDGTQGYVLVLEGAVKAT